MLRNMSLSLLQYAMHCGCMLPLKWVLVPLYTVSLCTADTATCMDTASTLYCMLCTAGTATCMDTASTLYCMLCTVGAATYVGSAAALYCILCILCSVHGCCHMCGTTLTYIMLGILHNMYSKHYCALSALHTYMLHGHVLM